MGDSLFKSDKTINQDGYKHYVLLTKDGKPICRTECLNPPAELPQRWTLCNIVPRSCVHALHGLPHCFLCPAAECSRDQSEWWRFLNYLQCKDSVGIAKFEFCEFYILPPHENSNFSRIRVAYQLKKAGNKCDGQKHSESVVDPQPHVVKQETPLEKNYVRADPSYLRTLGQAHSGWIFGAVAELVDNSRDARAAKLDISIEIIYSKRAGKDIPMLSVVDDGHGMTHQEVVRMTYFGHKQPDVDDMDRIGRFGVGFKTGAMRLGRDALVLTQTADSRSIAFLSQSLNEGKDNIEIPVVSYWRKGQLMELDTSVHSEALAKHNLKAIKEFSPFDKYLIGEKASLFRERCTGTQIYIWNLDEWGLDYCLEWRSGLTGGSSFHQGDIFIRSKRVRSRPGQINRKVRSRPLAKSLNRTSEVSGTIMGKHVHLTLGLCQLEWEQVNCGIFLYWHGRLIEAYKRVGGMIHNGDVGRGVIGIIDVTDLMNDGNGRVWVHNNKQGFEDCEPYARLEEWLGKRADEYLDKHFDKLQLRKGGSLYKPDHEWVQCDKCRKWRMLISGFDIKNLPEEWFCYMEPFNGSCEIPEQKVEHGILTVSAKRSGYDSGDDAAISSEGNSDDDFSEIEKDVKEGFKKLRRGLPRACKKT